MVEPPSDREKLTSARKHFIAMALTYSLGIFNDNFFKQAVLLIAVALGLNEIQGQATVLFSLPFILFSAWSGWLADRFAKRQVVIYAKFLELTAMLIGAYGILTMNWNCVLSMVFLMGLQSTLFTPALNGSIPELYSKEYITRANAILKLASTLSVLLGMALAGFALDQRWLSTGVPFGRVLVAVIIVLVGLFGAVSSFRAFSLPGSGARVPFPWTGPLNSIRDLILLRQDPLLLMAVCGDCFFYFISLLVVLVLNTLGIQQMGLSSSATSLLSVALMVGICGGAVLASKTTSHSRWIHVLVPGAVGMGISLMLAALLVSCAWGGFFLLLALLSLAGVFGGLFIIPLTSFMQVRPDARSKGRILGVDNFAVYSCMLLAGQLYPALDNRLHPSQFLLLLGTFFLAGGGVLFIVLRRVGELKSR